MAYAPDLTHIEVYNPKAANSAAKAAFKSKTAKPAIKKPKKNQLSPFEQAFASARKKFGHGGGSFTFQGKRYTTEYKEEAATRKKAGKKWSPALYTKPTAPKVTAPTKSATQSQPKKVAPPIPETTSTPTARVTKTSAPKPKSSIGAADVAVGVAAGALTALGAGKLGERRAAKLAVGPRPGVAVMKRPPAGLVPIKPPSAVAVRPTAAVTTGSARNASPQARFLPKSRVAGFLPKSRVAGYLPKFGGVVGLGLEAITTDWSKPHKQRQKETMEAMGIKSYVKMPKKTKGSGGGSW